MLQCSDPLPQCFDPQCSDPPVLRPGRPEQHGGQRRVNRGVATGWTGVVDMSPPLLPEVVLEIDTKPNAFCRGGEVGHVWSLTCLFANAELGANFSASVGHPEAERCFRGGGFS